MPFWPRAAMSDLAPATLAVLLAALLDGLFGEPRRLHPVAGIGRLLGALERALNKGSVAQRRRRGTLAWLLALAIAAPAAAAADALLRSWLEGAALAAALALLIKPALSLRGLVEAGGAVLRPLAAGNLDEARQQLGRHLVSRPTGDLAGDEIAGAAVASLAENFVDSVVAPLMWFALAGLPGLWAFRVINTADAMWGYRNARFEHFGRTAARADDVAAWPAARIGAALIWGGAALAGRAPHPARLRQEARRTPSPNGGWPMAAAALAMGIRLAKRGVYTLHDGGRPPEPADLHRARIALALLGAVAFGLTAAALELGR